MTYVMSIDGGGSKTACLVADGTGHLCGYGSGGPANTNYTKPEQVIQSIRSAIEDSLQRQDLGTKQIDTLYVSAPIAPDILQEGIHPFNISQVKRAPEGETPRWAARFWVDGRIGVTVDAGTGSLARGWSVDGKEAGAGGWGATLGDEGSGHWIGIQAMIAVLQASDGRIEPTGLTGPVLEHFGFSDLLDMVFKVSHGLVLTQDSDQIGVVPDSDHLILNGKNDPEGGLQFHKPGIGAPLTRYEVASLCPVVAEVAQRGDKTAVEIFKKAGTELGRLAVAVIKRLEMEGEEFAVVPFGGVFRADELVLNSFWTTIQHLAEKANLVKPKFEPVVGGILLALKSRGIKMDKSILTKLEDSSEKYPQIIIR